MRMQPDEKNIRVGQQMKKTALKRKKQLRAYTPLKTRTGLKAKTKLTVKQKTARKGKEDYWSIFTGDMHTCYITGDIENVEPHHIFQGKALKPLSEKYGFMLPLRSDWHRTGNYAIHRDRKLSVEYKILCQEHYISVLGKSREEWIEEFGRWWIEEK